jgi:hypothetical protein
MVIVAQMGGAAPAGAGAFFLQFKTPDIQVRPVFLAVAAGVGLGGSVGSAVSIPWSDVVRQLINPQFRPEWVRAHWLHREAYAQPIVPVGHSANIPPIATPLRGLYWASMSQVYPWDRGTNFAVEIGRDAARVMSGTGSGA